jgi:hypothetical protein
MSGKDSLYRFSSFATNKLFFSYSSYTGKSVNAGGNFWSLYFKMTWYKTIAVIEAFEFNESNHSF